MRNSFVINTKKITNKIYFILLGYVRIGYIFLSKKPSLCIISIGYKTEQFAYVNNKKKFARLFRISIIHYNLYKNYTEKMLKYLLGILSKQFFINGIIIQIPVPIYISSEQVFNYIHPKKDVDCLSPLNIGLLCTNQHNFISCTPLGCLYLFYEEKICIEGQNISIIGKSNIVAKPLLNILINKKATVLLIHNYSKNLPQLAKIGSILIISVGYEKLINYKYIKKGVIIIDIGINFNIRKNIVGDVDIKSVINSVKKITPVPGGIGILTVSMLFYNVFLSLKRNMRKK